MSPFPVCGSSRNGAPFKAGALQIRKLLQIGKLGPGRARYLTARQDGRGFAVCATCTSAPCRAHAEE